MTKITEQKFKEIFAKHYKPEDRWKAGTQFWKQKGTWSGPGGKPHKELLTTKNDCFEISALLQHYQYENDLSGLNLSSMSFANVSFDGINLSQCDLSECEFFYAIFTHCQMNDANIQGAKFKENKSVFNPEEKESPSEKKKVLSKTQLAAVVEMEPQEFQQHIQKIRSKPKPAAITDFFIKRPRPDDDDKGQNKKTKTTTTQTTSTKNTAAQLKN